MSRVCLSIFSSFLLVDKWTDLSQRGMATGAIVKHLQILENGLSGLGSGSKGVAIHAFLFDRSEKALHQGIIVTIGFFAHADFHTITAQKSQISLTRVLAATIGVMQQAWMWSSSAYSIMSASVTNCASAPIAHSPPDRHARVD